MIDNIIKSINKNSARYNDKIAIINNGLFFTYKDIDIMSNKVCNYLNHQSIGREDVVAIYMERSYLSVISILGILKAGAAFLPIDLKTPIKRAIFMIETSNAKCIITDIENINDFQYNISSINIHSLLNQYENMIDSEINANIGEEALAYILFTSGSTGFPKGAMIEHGGMKNHLSEKVRILNLDENSIVAHNASISFDVSIWQVLAPLCIGGTIVVFPEDSIINLKSFTDILCNNNVHVLEVVPTYLNLLINECRNRDYDVSNLKYLISTGEVLTEKLAERCFKVFPNILLVNAYGPTEASDDITHCVMEKNDSYNKIPIGKSINNIELTVVKPDGSLCEVDEIGELLVSGICVGRGYVGNDDETKSNFYVDEKTKQRVYRTGDLVSCQEDGNYIYHGRIDTQIAFHGKRIETKEIENIMLNYVGVNAAAVVFDYKHEQINACYVSDTELNINDIKNFLKTYLPIHMIPTIILKVKDIPVNLSGKADYEALNELIISTSNSKNDLVIGGGSHGSQLLQLIREVMVIDEFPSDEDWKKDLSLLGFNSISAIQLMVKIEEKYNFDFEDEYIVLEFLYNFNWLRDYIGKNVK